METYCRILTQNTIHKKYTFVILTHATLLAELLLLILI